MCYYHVSIYSFLFGPLSTRHSTLNQDNPVYTVFKTNQGVYRYSFEVTTTNNQYFNCYTTSKRWAA